MTRNSTYYITCRRFSLCRCFRLVLKYICAHMRESEYKHVNAYMRTCMLFLALLLMKRRYSHGAYLPCIKKTTKSNHRSVFRYSDLRAVYTLCSDRHFSKTNIWRQELQQISFPKEFPILEDRKPTAPTSKKSSSKHAVTMSYSSFS